MAPFSICKYEFITSVPILVFLFNSLTSSSDKNITSTLKSVEWKFGIPPVRGMLIPPVSSDCRVNLE